MLAETAKLAIQLDLKGNAAAGIRGIEQRLTGLNRQTGQISGGFKTLGAGIGVAFRNAAFLAIPVLTGLAAGLIKSVREGQAAAKTQAIYASAVANSGRVSAAYVTILAKQRAELMNLAGVDDELIQAEQTKLIQMGATGEQVAKLTPLILDMSKATGKDLLTSSLAVGKAINGNVGSLQRFGVFVDKAKFKVDPFAATMEALNKKFGGTTQALSGSLEARLGALREKLANIREEAGIKLLPALTKIVDVAGRKLVPAFGAFVDRILPSVISGVDKFAAILEGGGAERGIKGITDALGPMVEMLKIAAAPVKLIVDAFLKLPSQVQGVLIGAFAVNKLSGGLIGQGVGQIAKGVIGGAAGGLLQRGGTPATPLFVSDVAGGLGAAGGKGLGLISKVFLVGEAIGLALLVNEVRNGISDQSTKQSVALQGQLSEFIGKQPDQAALENALKGVKQGIVDLETSNLPLFLVQGEALDNLKKMRAQLEQQLAEAKGARLTGNLGRPGPMVRPVVDLREGVLARAIAAGFHPSAAAIQRTLDNNAAHLEESIYVATVGKREDRQDTKDRGNAPDAPKAAAIAAIQARAIAKGLHPSLAQLQRTFENNEDRLQEIAYANTTGMQDVRSAIKETTSAVRALPGQLRTALGGLLYTGGGRASKDDIVRGPSVQKTQNLRERASGGPVRRGLGYLVGEQGPEWFQPDQNGKIIPKRDPRMILRENARAYKDESEYVRTVIAREDRANQKDRDASLRRPQGPHRREIENYRAMREEDAYVRTVVRREKLFEKKERPIQAHVNVSTRDVNKSQNLKRRYGPTYTQAGAG